MSKQVVSETLRNSLLALASPAKVQLSIYPDFVCVGDELVLDFAEIYDQLDLTKLTPKENNVISELDNFLTSHSGDKYKEHYLNNNMLSSSLVWQKIRLLAKEALISFGWEYIEPDKSCAIYISRDDASS